MNIELINNIWNNIFDSLQYNENEDIIITSFEIKKYMNNTKLFCKRSLLCLHNSENENPDFFKKNGLFLISIKDGVYLLQKVRTYQDLFYDEHEPIKINKNNELLLLNKNINDKISLINNLRYSNIFENNIYLNGKIIGSTEINSRKPFKFEMYVENKKINVKTSKYSKYIDALYESNDNILIISYLNNEYKNTFNIQNIYYSYRYIYDKIKTKKNIITILIKYDTKIIHIWKYLFDNPFYMNSIKLNNYSKYEFIE